jgi:hypothetical protein
MRLVFVQLQHNKHQKIRFLYTLTLLFPISRLANLLLHYFVRHVDMNSRRKKRCDTSHTRET